MTLLDKPYPEISSQVLKQRVQVVNEEWVFAPLLTTIAAWLDVTQFVKVNGERVRARPALCDLAAHHLRVQVMTAALYHTAIDDRLILAPLDALVFMVVLILGRHLSPPRHKLELTRDTLDSLVITFVISDTEVVSKRSINYERTAHVTFLNRVLDTLLDHRVCTRPVRSTTPRNRRPAHLLGSLHHSSSSVSAGCSR
jgi:hypothetical protein